MPTRPRLSVACLLSAAALSACSPASIPPSSSPAPVPQRGLLSLERIFDDPPLAGRPPFQAKFSPDGAWVAWLRGNEGDSEIADLWVVRVPDGKPVRLAESKGLMDPQAARKTEAERMVEERRHVRHKGITSWQWCGKRQGRILFGLSGSLYLADASAGTVKKIPARSAVRLGTQCSHDGATVAYVRDGELHAMDVATGSERKLTTGATETRTHGLAEFVAQEEMGRHEGFFWSPNDTKIAWLEVDESQVAVRTRHRIQADGTETVTQRYPAAGQNNARVALFVLDVASGKSEPIELPKQDGYVARVGWFSDGEPWVQWQSRDQKRLELSAGTGKARRTLLEDTDADWVELDDHLHACGASGFTWSSEKSGTNQLYLHDRKTESAGRRVGVSEDPLTGVVTIDEACSRGLVLRATNRGREQHLFEIEMGSGKERQLTREPGWHEVVADEQGKWLFDLHSAIGRPIVGRLMDASGRVVQQIDPEIPPEFGSVRWPQAQLVEVRAQDGTPLNGVLLPPMEREPGRKYPVVVYAYGGPSAQVAADRWSRGWPFHAWLTQRGFGVFMLDNRGSSNRERAFTRAIHYRFGQVEYADQVSGAHFLRTIPWVDGDRIGIWGWSYGGYLSALAILREGNPFRAATAVAPVSDWRLYDTHYTERYMGMPQERSALYEKASLLPLAQGLRKPLLVVHGMADDNVLFEHSVRLVAALQDKSIPFELMVYPGGAHGLKGRATQLHVYRTLAAFMERNLTAR